MPIDFTGLNSAVTALTNQVAATEGTEASAAALINGFSQQIQKAVADAIKADDAADQGTADAVNQAIAAVTQRFTQSANALGSAVAANNPNPPAPAPAS